MSEDHFRLLPEGLRVDSVVDDDQFTEISRDGEVYTLYKVVRFTHDAVDHPDGWTHRANVSQVRQPAMGVALLRVVDREIDHARVTLSPHQS